MLTASTYFTLKGSTMNILVTTRIEQRVIKLKGSFTKSVLRDLKTQKRKKVKVHRSSSKTRSTFQSLINRITCRHRNTDCSVSPAQIPACGITTLGADLNSWRQTADPSDDSFHEPLIKRNVSATTDDNTFSHCSTY